MKKLILGFIALLILADSQVAIAESKSVSIAVSCVVPERLVLSLPAPGNLVSVKEEVEKEIIQSPSPFIQQEEKKGDNLIYTVAAR